MTTVRLSRRNQIVLPKEARRRLGVEPGDPLLVVPKGQAVVVVAKPADMAKGLRGTGRGVYGGARRYLRGQRRSWKRKGSAKS